MVSAVTPYPEFRSYLSIWILLFLLALQYPVTAYSAEAFSDSELDINLADADISGEKIRVFLIPKDEATISAEIDGKITYLPFVMGETFKEGDTLVKIDSELAEAAKERAEKELEASRINLEAIQDLRSRQDATLVELINAERDYAVAKSGVILAEKNLKMCRILAPFSGRIIEVMKNEHELAKNGEPLIHIIDDNTLLAHFLLPISEFPNTAIGSEVVVTIPLLEKDFTATISQISATLDAASGTFEVAADIDNSEQLLRAGMSGWFTPQKTENPE